MNIPSPPPMTEWRFLEDFKKKPPVRPKSRRKCPPGFADWSGGVTLKGFSNELLLTAYRDFYDLLGTMRIPTGTGHAIAMKLDPVLEPEEFILDSDPEHSRISAGAPEGIRRAVYFLMDELERSPGKWIPCGTRRRKPFVKIRISRCCYGPKKRPPLPRRQVSPARLNTDPEYRDELIDGREYFPSAYLGRLAREGVNGLWIAASFRELCHTPIMPEYGLDAEPRLEKLREIVQRCLRYGIKIYLLCIEPEGFKPGELRRPGLAGCHFDESYGFCTSTEQGRRYVEESCFQLFSRVPGLGGLIDICVGERLSHCSSVYLDLNNCPLCSRRPPGDILRELLETMLRGMRRAAPDAELIAWPYSSYIVWGEEKTVEAVKAIPRQAVLLHNFESRGKVRQSGKIRTLDDYWLAYAGPSRLYRKLADEARKHGIRPGAKIQAACSYELATVPFVPVPGILYDKYREMRRLGVEMVLESWLVGSWPSCMTRATGMLAMEPFPENRDAFLLELAGLDWGEAAPEIVQAWKLFERGYVNFPYSRLFSYYSPLNAGTAWPLFLRPRDTVLYPPFRANCPPSGDRIGECLGRDFTLPEVLHLLQRMLRNWKRGLAILHNVIPRCRRQPERLRDIGVAEAIAILMQSAYHIFRFYQLREELIASPDLKILKSLENIVKKEIRNSGKLRILSGRDCRLGFQADSECHIFYPEKLQWRMNQLRNLLRTEFDEARKIIMADGDLYPEYTGKAPGKFYTYPAQRNLLDDGKTYWKASRSRNGLRITVTGPPMEFVELSIERQRLWPPLKLRIDSSGRKIHLAYEAVPNHDWQAEYRLKAPGKCHIVFSIPRSLLDFTEMPGKLRLNIRTEKHSWAGWNPLPPRLLQPDDNPVNFGWLFFKKP